MDLFRGLKKRDEEIIRHVASRQDFPAGSVIFHEGDKADGLYLIISGKVEVYRLTSASLETPVARLGPGDIVGEMGILVRGGKRNASVRAVDHAMLLRIPANPVDLFASIQEQESALSLMENIIWALELKLRRKYEPGRSTPGIPLWTPRDLGINPQMDLRKIREGIPSGFFRTHFGTKTLKAGEFLYWEGEPAEQIFFLDAGELEILNRQTDRIMHFREYLAAPCVVGEEAIFPDETRNISCRARTDVKLIPFERKDIEDLKKKDPEKALDMLYALARIIILRILHLENA